jgi:hypothetical protein
MPIFARHRLRPGAAPAAQIQVWEQGPVRTWIGLTLKRLYPMICNSRHIYNVSDDT